MGEIYGWVKNIVIFLVLTTIITNLLGKSSYKKYVNLITGIILVILVISPLLKLFQLDKTMDYYFTTNSLLAEAEDMNDKLVDAEDNQMSAILKEYKEQIGKQVSNLLEGENLYLTGIEVKVDEDENSSTFGNLLSLNISAGYIRNETKEGSVDIDKVDIEDIKIGEKKENETDKEKNLLTPIEINIKNLLSDFYNMNPDNINISIQEK
ncbi:stage III sporulation protein AF [Anaerocolumna sedimenticola]|uniref:Stage III sporulation protein AF n=1 Tax=Anaerocolumna sedimenticola TaxID=2696063 RepID=A0A6P1TTK9_9FIRM|nr:stage III sporulation protein AF [Anaerocolumna sedimenticola]QHQ62775.1 stage III sporulation protein AF [Anaerocolumna sedimenticola]